MRKFLITAAALTCVALAVGVYLPIPGQIALDAADADYAKCMDSLGSYQLARETNEPQPFHHLPDPFDCVAAYLDRKEAISWRYFFFQTVAMRLQGHYQ